MAAQRLGRLHFKETFGRLVKNLDAALWTGGHHGVGHLAEDATAIRLHAAISLVQQGVILADGHHADAHRT